MEDSSADMLKSPRRTTGVGMKKKTESLIKASFTANEEGRPRSS